MTPPLTSKICLVEYPASQSYTTNSIQAAFSSELPEWRVITHRRQLEQGETPSCEWSDYDELDWDAASGGSLLVNSYAIRKALIRKNHLSHTLALYLSKNPTSPLRQSAPSTVYFNLSFADELDELLQDELYDVALSFQQNEEKEDEAEHKWWILKAALADKGNGIRLFSTREQLEAIFEEFEESSSEEEEDSEEEEETGRNISYGSGTRVNASQMREWVIQEYISSPLLLDPTPNNASGIKFHLRVYVLAVGGLTVYVHHPYLALFAPTPYERPTLSETDDGSAPQVDLSSHLTNTCLQSAVGEEAPEVAVRTLQALAGRIILAGPSEGEKLGEERIRAIEDKVCEVVKETFKAAVGAGSAFQTLPNAFEIFGVDLLVDDQFGVHLMEVNAGPDFTQTGAELQSVIAELFKGTVNAAVKPFFADQADGEVDGLSEAVEKLEVDGKGLRKVLELQVRGGP